MSNETGTTGMLLFDHEYLIQITHHRSDKNFLYLIYFLLKLCYFGMIWNLTDNDSNS